MKPIYCLVAAFLIACLAGCVPVDHHNYFQLVSIACWAIAALLLTGAALFAIDMTKLNKELAFMESLSHHEFQE